MRAHPRWLVVGLVGLVGGVAPALADPTFEQGKREDVKDVDKVVWTAKGEAGLVATTGNSKTTTITAGANATRKDKDNKFDVMITGAFARATTRIAADANGNGVIDPGELSSTTATSAENVAGKVRYDRYLTPLDALYLAVLGGFDKPAGKTFQGGFQVGYSRGLYKTENHEVLGELGYDLSYVSLEAGGSTTLHSLRAFAGYKGKLSKDTAVESSLEALFNVNSVTIGGRDAGAFGDARLNGLVGVTTSLSSKFSLTASFAAKYDNVPAPLAKVGALPFAPGYAPAADQLDTITKLTLILKFL